MPSLYEYRQMPIETTPSARRTGVCSPLKAQMDIKSIF